MGVRLSMAVVLTALLVLPGPVRAQGVPVAPEWVPLGPGGPWRASSVAVSSDWPADPFLVARLEPPGPPASSPRAPTPNDPPSTARSADGGRTWQAMSRVPSGTLDVIRTGQYGRVLLAFGADSSSSNDPSLVIARSTDDGDTWSTVASLALGRGEFVAPIVAHSPALHDDARLMVRAGGKLFDSQDAGLTWQRIDPAAGQRVVGAVFSPEFAHDRTIYLAAATTRHYLRPNPGNDPIYTAAAESAGVLIPHDGGASWSSLAAGLQADGQPYRHVEELAISPTFARDGTLFVFAWGVWPRHTTADYDYVSPLMGLFRSRDRGESWELVWDPDRRANGERGSGGVSRQAEIAVSPSFADDGAVMLSMSMSGVSAAATSCNLVRSGDGGSTWLNKGGPDYGGCSRVAMVTGPAPVFIWSSSRQGSRTFSVSYDLGATDTPFELPGWGPPYNEERYTSQTLAAGGTFLLATSAGVWARGPGAAATGGLLPCDAGEPIAFATVRLAAISAGPWLGCPLAVPAAVELREQRLGDVRALWLEDGGPDWFELSTPARRGPIFARHPKATEPWVGAPDRVLAVELLTYQGGMIVRSDAAGLAYVLAYPRWQELSGI